MKILLVQLESSFPHAKFLQKKLSEEFGMETMVHPGIVKIPNGFFNLRKHKWDAEKIISMLREHFSNTREGKFLVLGLCLEDIFADSLNFVYGLGEKNGNFGVVSGFRLNPTFYNESFDLRLFETRALKESTHEIGHMLNLDHCKNKRCVMSFSPNIIFVDRKEEKFCQKCKYLL
ncbi:archaemetzincin family Zn-dependent metalloprotease [Candidatus Micrarchaeota archaeon]|nr:archaemetzincin family Zn-dependent metalloprotease [Candidatus Micrarchaeota archaeon]